MKRIATLFKISAIASALLVSMVWSITSYSDTDTSKLTYKEKIQLEVKSNVSTNVSAALKDAVASCKANQDTSTCKDECPFHLLQKQKSIDCLSTCITKTTLSCVSKTLIDEDIQTDINQPANSETENTNPT